MKTHLRNWLASALAILATTLSGSAAAPRIASVAPPSGSSTVVLTEITVQFDQAVTGVDARDLIVAGRPATSVDGAGTSYTFSFSQPPAGTVDVRFAPDSAIASAAVPRDLFETGNVFFVFTIRDIAAPEPALVHPPPGATVRRLNQVEVLFNEPVTGVTAGSLLINGQPATNVVGVSAGPYRFEFPEVTGGAALAQWAGSHGIVDLAAPPNRFSGAGGWAYTINAGANTTPLVISEFLAGNTNGLRDEENNTQDWIELHNPTGSPVRLLGWSLTDDTRLPGKWTFPDVTLAAGGRLVVFASGLDRRPAAPGGKLHTNFRLGKNGGYLALNNLELPRAAATVFSPAYPPQRNDHSFGLDAGGQWKYFRDPTPGLPNAGRTLSGLVEPPHFNVERGIYSLNSPFQLSLASATPFAAIRYTLDGSEPTETHGALYSSPILIDRTAIVRAIAFRPNALPSEVVTHTYLFNLDAAAKSLPVVSIVTAPRNLFGPTGIMEFNPKNTLKHGIAWERPTSVELIRPEDNGGFQVNAGLRVLGGETVRDLYNYNAGPPNGKYSFGLYFRGDYGPRSLNYRLFEHVAAEGFERIHLRAGFNDPINPFIYDELVRRLMLDMGHLASHGTTVNLFLNGVYQGYYNPVERITPEFLQKWHGGSAEWDILEQNEGLRDGTLDEWQRLKDFMYSADFSLPANYVEAGRRLDLVNFVDYVLLNVYIAMGDWPFNNWRSARERVPGAKWRFYNWDSEVSFGNFFQARNVQHNEFTNEMALTFTPISRFYTRLKASPEFRLLFADRAQHHFQPGGALHGTNVLHRYEELRRRMALTIPAMNDTIPRTWVPQRRDIIFGQMATEGLLPTVAAPSLSRPGGPVARGTSLTINAPAGTIHYTLDGSDPRVPFTGTVAANAQTVASGGTITLAASATISARARVGDIWSALTSATYPVAEAGNPVRIVEIMYNPAGSEAHEFLELLNTGGAAVDLGGAYFAGIDFRFPDGSRLSPGQRIVLASGLDPASFAARYPGRDVFGRYGGALNNGGEKITLYDRAGAQMTSVEYDDERGWPAQADGLGPSLEIIDPFGTPSDPANWRASIIPGGTPGTPGTAPGGGVVLSEVMVLNQGFIPNGGATPPWIELHNPGATEVPLTGWTVGNDANPRAFSLNFGATIPAGGHLVLWCDSRFEDPGLHTGFGLGAPTERIYLHNPAGQRVDAVALGLHLVNTSVARVEGRWVLAVPTPGGPNIAAPLAATSQLAINEWLADPPPGESDWIEIFNRDGSFPAALQGTSLTVNGRTFRISSPLHVPARGHVQLFADEQPGFDHLDLRLPAAGATIILRDEAGNLIDQVTYGPQVEGFSEGRVPDGSGTIARLGAGPSPKQANNLAPLNSAVFNELMARNQSATADSAGRFPDWVELFNPTANTLNLGGLGLGFGSTASWRFPGDTGIPGHGYLLVWFDPLRPASAQAETELNCGLRLDGNGGTLTLFGPAGQIADQIQFGSQIPNQSIGRTAQGWALLASPTPGAENGAPAPLGSGLNVRVNEWLADPVNDEDWFELYNDEELPVSVAGFFITDDISEAGQRKHAIAPLSFIGPGGWARWIADGNTSAGPDHVPFGLNRRGDSLRLSAPNGTVLDTVTFGPQTPGVSQGRQPDGAPVIVSFAGSASPGESNHQLLSNLVINEVLVFAGNPFEPAIEILNLSGQPVNIGGWYLSDDGANLKKYRVRVGTIVPAGGFHAFYEGTFGDPWNFSLRPSAGGAVHLSAVDRFGEPNGFQAVARLHGSEFGISQGRVTGAGGVSDFVPLAQKTFGVDAPAVRDQFRAGRGAPNAAPLEPAVVINEIHYHPVEAAGAQADDEEFIELLNKGFTPVLLFDPARPENRWRLAGNITFHLPQLVLQPAAMLVVVRFNPETNPAAAAAFRARYGLPSSVLLAGPFAGRLSNEGATLELLKPRAPDTSGREAGVVPYVLVDRVRYLDRAPWPVEANGGGLSLQRQNRPGFGSDPALWAALPPTAGQPNPAAPVLDADGDGIPDAWEIANGLNPADPADAGLDSDGDGYSNLDEFRAGTNPQNAASVLRFTSVASDFGFIFMTFEAGAGRKYEVQFTSDVVRGPWQTIDLIETGAVAQTAEVAYPGLSAAAGYYRLVAR